jgi:hypothetical protein
MATILEPLRAQGRLKGFVTASSDAGLVKEYIQKVEQALADYQVCSPTGSRPKCFLTHNSSL